ncbi:MAG: flagellar protein FliS [Ignavibacteria bacterium]|jgi:flagellin-specific chaperone FliS|nr:flagellar protein FliS [Ignavibacteria bacterium]
MALIGQQLAANKLYANNKKVPGYLEQEVYSWSKEKLILKMYDLFIVSTKRGDTQKMTRVLVELMGALNFEYEETSTRLYRLYEYCQRCIFQNKSDEALYIITELRNTWAKAFNLEEKPKKQEDTNITDNAVNNIG